MQPEARPSIRDILALPLLQRILGRFVDVADRAVRDSMLDWSSLPVIDTVPSESAQDPQSDGNVLTATNELVCALFYIIMASVEGLLLVGL